MNKINSNYILFDSTAQRLQDYKVLTKLGLTTTIVISALFGYIMYGGWSNWPGLILLIIAGYLVTASANTFNQILEKDTDKLMQRTAKRPLVLGRISITEALLFAGFSGLIGVLILWYCFNIQAAFIGALSLFSYSFIYTPFKKISPIAVLIGAFPGAFPIVIGWLAASGGQFSIDMMYLFSIQFLWQFPHFWSIAWMSDDDYRKAGFYLLPTREGKNKQTAILCLLYIIVLISLVAYYCFYNDMNVFCQLGALILGTMFLLYGYKLYKELENTAARKLMFASIIYLPLLQLLFIIDKLFLH